MKRKLLFKKLLFFCAFLLPLSVLAQTISGKITDDNGDAIPFANIIEKGTSNGTTSDADGNFSLTVNQLPVIIVVSSLGFTSKELEVTDASKAVNITLAEDGVGLDEVVVTGNRAKPRTILDSPVPIDNVSAKELTSSGQISIDQMLTYKIPSYNSTNQTISDATAHFDPAELRGLGPSRTLVLVNGKRKNLSALVYINDTPGKGEVGTDMKSIPTAAIDHVEVLRDGASAQYGSDAIAGVVNIILKKDVEYSTINVNSGITTEGDGFNFGADFNSSINITGGGYLNYTLGFYKQEHTNRAGTPGGDGLFGVIFGDDDILNGNTPWLRENPDLGMTIGQPDIDKVDLMVNAGVPFKNGKGEFYAFAGITMRNGTSFALYRAPYWVTDPFNLLHEAGTEYQGFQPTFETDITDNIDGLGVKFELGKFNIDVSGTFGMNSVDYTIGNTLNPDLGADSPTNFDAGAYAFRNLLANLDVTRSFGDVGISFGAEVRREDFTVKAGESASYIGGGAQSFPGLQPSNALSEGRNSTGAYFGLEWDATEEFLIGGAVRYEDFSDFGDNTSWKVNARYKLGDKGAIRGSYSTGFRAPALHQIYLSNIQTLVSGGTVSNQGTFNNVDPVIREGLGVPQLKAETATNISTGITYKVTNDFSLSLDYYNVKVDDRVLFTGEIGFDGVGEQLSDPGISIDNITPTNPVEEILKNTKITSLKFFTNAVNTETQGIDFVANYNNVELGSGNLDVTLAFNWNDTEIVGEIATPQLLASNGYEIFNRKEASRITSARPNIKGTLGLNYNNNKFKASLNNTYFGEVTWQHADDPGKDQTFAGKLVTDLVLGYDFSDKIGISITANNILNVYPDVIDTKGDFVTDLGGRFKYPWEVNQFGFLGTVLKAGLTFRF